MTELTRRHIGWVFKTRFGGWYVDISDLLITDGMGPGDDRSTAAGSLAKAREAARELAGEWHEVEKSSVRLVRDGGKQNQYRITARVVVDDEYVEEEYG